MQIEFEFDEDDDTRNALLSPSSVHRVVEPFVSVGELAQAVVLRLASEYPRIRCGRPREEERPSALTGRREEPGQ